jgi:hypothetical protein
LATKQIASALASSSAASPGSFDAERPGRRVMPKAVKVVSSLCDVENSAVSVGLAPG